MSKKVLKWMIGAGFVIFVMTELVSWVLSWDTADPIKWSFLGSVACMVLVFLIAREWGDWIVRVFKGLIGSACIFVIMANLIPWTLSWDATDPTKWSFLGLVTCLALIILIFLVAGSDPEFWDEWVDQIVLLVVFLGAVCLLVLVVSWLGWLKLLMVISFLGILLFFVDPVIGIVSMWTFGICVMMYLA